MELCLTSIEPEPDLIIQAVIFDCDGILVDTEPLHYRAFQKVLVPFGLAHDFAHYLEQFVGFDDRETFVHAFREAGIELEAATLQRLIQTKSMVLRELVEQGVPSFPGVVDLVKELMGRGIPMAVASGALRHEVEAFIASLGLSEAFRTIVAADDVKKSKPDPETYLLAIERLGLVFGPLDPSNCVAVEDTPAGIRSAKSAALPVIAVTNSFPESELSEADKIVRSLADLSLPDMAAMLKHRRMVH
jgi:beta-phosphoglucomutase